MNPSDDNTSHPPILLATGNHAKQETLRWLLEGAPVVPVTPAEAGVSADPDESAETHLAIAEDKAREWSEAGQMLVIASDGGLVIPALGGDWESRYTHRFAGPAADDRERARRLLEVMAPLRGEERSASWVEAVAVADRGKVLASWDLTGATGYIVEEMPPEVDTSGFWVFSLWRFPRFGKIYHDLTAEEKESLDDHWTRLRELVQEFFMTTSRPFINDPYNAFCQDSDAFLPGAPGGPLAGLSFAAKDIFDVAGHVTGGGNPDWKATHEPASRNAWVVQTLVDAGAAMVGKTITDELTRGIFGENAHYGTPVNPRAPGRVPGGSSSGSASAVAGGLVDFALGSDTGGSVRVPASFCGLYGLRPTHGLIPLDGILLQAPSYDTIGWFARDIETFTRVAETLFAGKDLDSTRPARVIIAQDAFELAEPAVAGALLPLAREIGGLCGESATEVLSPQSLAEWSGHQQVLQSREAWDSVKDWIDTVNPRFSFEVSDRYVTAREITDAQVDAAQAGRDAILRRMDQVFGGGTTVVCLPSTVSPAPPLGQRVSERHSLRLRNSALTSVAGNTGRPQLSIPAAEVDGLPVGLSLLGNPGSDLALIALAREYASSRSTGG